MVSNHEGLWVETTESEEAMTTIVFKLFDADDHETGDSAKAVWAVRLVLDDKQNVISHTVFTRKVNTNGTGEAQSR